MPFTARIKMDSKKQIKKNKFYTPEKKIYLYSILVGLITGSFAILFNVSLSWFESFCSTFLFGIENSHPANEYVFHFDKSLNVPRYFIIIVPAIGAFLGALIVYKISPEAQGLGTEGMIRSFHHDEGNMKKSTPFVKSIATILTLGSGGSAGKEGPMAQIGAAIGSIVAQMQRFGARARRTLLLAGAAGGLGAIFKAPFGGALTAIEVIYKKDIETDSLIPCILSSATAYIVYCSFMGFNTLFVIPEVSFQSHLELIIYIILGFVCVFVGKLYIITFKFFKQKIFQRLKIHYLLKPALGGLLVGTIIYFIPASMGSGMGFLQDMLDGSLDLSRNSKELFQLFLFLMVIKIISTSLTLGSGGSGGIFGPSLFIGALLGGAIGSLASFLFPNTFTSYIPFVIVGMSAFFAGVANAPIATLVMVCEMTGGYNLLPPLLIVSVITIIFANEDSIYEGQIENRFVSPAHIWDMNVDMLRHMSIKDVLFSLEEEQSLQLKMSIIPDNTSFQKMQELSLDTHSTDFIALDSEKKYLGTASLSRVNEQLSLGLIAYDIAEKKRTVSLYDDLSIAVENMLFDNVDKIAVLDAEGRVFACLEYKFILKIYRNQAKKKIQLNKPS